MLHVRRSAAWLLLAAAVFGGTVAPVVHRVAHGLEREALGVAHAADGHHVAGEQGAHLHEPCTTRFVDDTACTLCQSVAAAVLTEADARASDAPDVRLEAGAETRAHSRPVGAATGRGPPESVA